MDNLQARLNNSLRKTVVFDYGGKKYTANLNLTMKLFLVMQEVENLLVQKVEKLILLQVLM